MTLTSDSSWFGSNKTGSMKITLKWPRSLALFPSPQNLVKNSLSFAFISATFFVSIPHPHTDGYVASIPKKESLHGLVNIMIIIRNYFIASGTYLLRAQSRNFIQSESFATGEIHLFLSSRTLTTKVKKVHC